jgi:hypothetical protein
LHQPERDDLRDHGNEQRAGGVRLLGQLAQIVQMAVEVRRLHHHARHRVVDLRGQLLLARRRRRQRHDLMLRQPRHRRDGLAVVRVQVAGQHRLVPPGDAVRHQHGLRRRGRAVVHRGVRHLEPRQRRHLRLELEQVLQRALGDLRLIGRVGGQELRALDQVIDGRRHVVLVGAGADEEGHRPRRDILRSEPSQLPLDLHLPLCLRQVDRCASRLSLGMSANSASMSGTPILASMIRRSAS